MALVVNVGRKDFIAPSGATYTLKTMISGYERRQIDQSGMLVQTTKADLFDTEADDALVYYKPNAAERELNLLSTYIAGWDHEDENGKPASVTKKHLKQLPPNDWDFLVKEITELQKEQYGPTEKSDLGKSSKTSSGS